MQQVLKKTKPTFSSASNSLYYSFTKLDLLNKKEVMLYNKLGSPKPFDVTLRDGLQSLSKENQKLYTLEKKKKFMKK